ncbi:MAG: hypothetical protein KGL67_00600 [Patescibacteria group bacterium]|nr:hypothetical protein [Patescibacteria group bacterium]
MSYDDDEFSDGFKMNSYDDDDDEFSDGIESIPDDYDLEDENPERDG